MGGFGIDWYISLVVRFSEGTKNSIEVGNFETNTIKTTDVQWSVRDKWHTFSMFSARVASRQEND